MPTRTWGLGGALTGLLIVISAATTGMLSQPGATLRQIQKLQIDATLGSPSPVGDGDEAIITWSAGPRGATTIVFIHGFGDSASAWAPVASSLSVSHHVFAFDLPGHGRSEPRTAPLTLELVQAGAERALDSLEPPYVVVGNSLGGWVAVQHALRHPDRVAALILINNAGLDQPLDKDLLLPTTREGMRAKSRAVMGDRTPPLPDFVLDGLLALHADPRLGAFFDELTRRGPFIEERLPALGMPTTLMWGTPDPFFPADSYLQRMRDALPEADVIRLEGCGHAPQYSCPEELADAVRDALP